MPQIAGAKRFHRGASCWCSSCCCCSCCCCGVGDDACGHYYWEGGRSKHGLLFLSLKWNKAGALESYDDGDVSLLISILQQGLLQLCPFSRILETFKYIEFWSMGPGSFTYMNLNLRLGQKKVLGFFLYVFLFSVRFSSLKKKVLEMNFKDNAPQPPATRMTFVLAQPSLLLPQTAIVRKTTCCCPQSNTECMTAPTHTTNLI